MTLHNSRRTASMRDTLPSCVFASCGMRFDDESDSTRRRWGASFAIVLLLHAAPVALAVWWLDSMRTAPTPPPQPPAIMIDLAPLPAASPVPPTEIPRVPKQERVKPAHDARKPLLPPVRKADVALPENPSPPQPRHSDDDHTPVPQTTAPPTAAAAPTASAAAPTATANASMSATSWQALLLGRLQQFKRYPADAQARNQQGVAYLRFTMDRSGRVLAFRLEKSSSYTLLDEEALALIQRAEPLPALPPSIPGDPLELVVPIEFFLKDRR